MKKLLFVLACIGASTAFSQSINQSVFSDRFTDSIRASYIFYKPVGTICVGNYPKQILVNGLVEANANWGSRVSKILADTSFICEAAPDSILLIETSPNGLGLVNGATQQQLDSLLGTLVMYQNELYKLAACPRETALQLCLQVSAAHPITATPFIQPITAKYLQYPHLLRLKKKGEYGFISAKTILPGHIWTADSRLIFQLKK